MWSKVQQGSVLFFENQFINPNLTLLSDRASPPLPGSRRGEDAQQALLEIRQGANRSKFS